jgi:hypothetical protein
MALSLVAKDDNSDQWEDDAELYQGVRTPALHAGGPSGRTVFKERLAKKVVPFTINLLQTWFA